MVDRNAAKWALLVGGALLTVLVAGQVLRFLTRMLAWAGLALLAAVAVYVVYQVLKGAGAAESSDATTDATPVEDLKEAYASGDLSEREFERELDDVMDLGGGTDLGDGRVAAGRESGDARTDEERQERETGRR